MQNLDHVITFYLHFDSNKTGNRSVELLHLDLGSLSSVRAVAREVKEAHSRLDGVVCNAGVWVPMEKHAKTSDGFEVHFGVNHLGHFLLAQLLLEQPSPLSKYNGRSRTPETLTFP